MISKLCLFLFILEISYSTDLYEDEESSSKIGVTIDNIEFEPVVTITKEKEKSPLTKNLNCDEFSKYAKNCTLEAALIYNSSRKSPPMPGKMNDWCRAIRHLTNCAIDWNSECKDVTDSHFNEESIKGHMHVVDNVCDDEWFLARYDELPQCIEASASTWEACYTDFKSVVDRQKNGTEEWTHYVTHFYLCCARTRFRRCTLDALFDPESVSIKCSRDNAISLQKFTVIVSKGDVYQDCDHNVMYTNCPGGDPRPNERMVGRLMNADAETVSSANVFRACTLWCYLVYVLCVFLMCLIK